ncbi:MAG: hypothetical protein OEZ34_14850 [Spirochaetia bacterium]|nr:hypothetical protein [Spirochaetia bacterium]
MILKNRRDKLNQFIPFLGTIAGTFLLVLFLDPIPQDQDYHNFADRRTFFGIPNFFDVVSNLPFFFAGGYGFYMSAKKTSHWIQPAWNFCFIGVAMIAFGSAYYHFNPDNTALIWDRLPMAVGFMGLFSALIGENINLKLGRHLLLPSLAAGLLSIVYWQMHDDLRFYIWVQGIPLLLILVSAFFFKSHYSHRQYLIYGLMLYILAKLFELFDREIYEWFSSTAGGHSLKHLSSAAAVFILAEMIRIRKEHGSGSTGEEKIEN